MLFHSLQGAGGFSSVLPTITYNNYYLQAKVAASSSITFTAVDLGTATSDRLVAVYFSTGTSNSGQATAVTIQGISATQAVRSGTGNVNVTNVIWYATVPTGTTGDVVVTFSTTWGNTQNAFLSSVSMYDVASTTPITASATGNTSSLSGTLTPDADAVLFAAFRAASVASGSTTSWTNATEQTDLLDGTLAYTDAISSGLANSSLTVTATNTDAVVTAARLLVATWR